MLEIGQRQKRREKKMTEELSCPSGIWAAVFGYLVLGVKFGMVNLIVGIVYLGIWYLVRCLVW